MRPGNSWPPPFPALPQVDLNVGVQRVVDDWVSLAHFRPEPRQWVYVFIDERFLHGGQNMGYWTRRNGRMVWMLRNMRQFAAVPVTHWKPLFPDPQSHEDTRR